MATEKDQANAVTQWMEVGSKASFREAHKRACATPAQRKDTAWLTKLKRYDTSWLEDVVGKGGLAGIGAHGEDVGRSFLHPDEVQPKGLWRQP